MGVPFFSEMAFASLMLFEKSVYGCGYSWESKAFSIFIGNLPRMEFGKI
jgi:hypothetical protein